MLINSLVHVTVLLSDSNTLYPIKMPRKQSGRWVIPASASKKKQAKFSKSFSSTVPSLGTSRTPTVGNPDTLTIAETNPFSALGEKDRGRNYGGSTYPVETSRASALRELQGMNTSSPNPDEKEGELTPGDADIPDSIDRALLDALQKWRTGINLPSATTPPVARFRTI